jgi:hypothetical protein
VHGQGDVQLLGRLVHRPERLVTEGFGQAGRGQHTPEHAQLGDGAPQLLDRCRHVLHRQQGHALQARVVAQEAVVQPGVVPVGQGHRPVRIGDQAEAEPGGRKEHRRRDVDLVEVVDPLLDIRPGQDVGLAVGHAASAAVVAVQRREKGHAEQVVAPAEGLGQVVKDLGVRLDNVPVGVNHEWLLGHADIALS